MVSRVKKFARGWNYDAVSIGYPGPGARALDLTGVIFSGFGQSRFSAKPCS
jgi:hypothetical protein